MTQRRRCLIYTRKSTDEGLEQDFNSLHAQREACEAYIKSQAHEGWRLIPGHFDDGGYSGGSMERPALQRLLADINAGLVDTIVVYKVDRLTRSLSDFARMVETFDAKGVSFVSVTQQFNTTTSMGRLTLNVLLSFAQFEREVTAERIRDKIAASKQKGIWMGGMVPFGYEAKNRELLINQQEAQTVRKLFDLYLKLGTVMKLKAEADRLGLVTKRRTVAGRTTGGGSFTRGHLHQLLSNPIYAGQIVHKRVIHPGRHPAIIDPETFAAVQCHLADRATRRRSEKNALEPSLLTGLVFDETGDRLCPTHTSKKGRRYRYYISKRLMHKSDNVVSGGWRLPARELEAGVLQAIQAFLKNDVQLVKALKPDGARPDQLRRTLADAAKAADRLRNELSHSQQQLVSSLIRRIDLRAESMHIEITRSGLAALFADRDLGTLAATDDAFTYIVPVRLKRRGIESKLVMLAGLGECSPPDMGLVGILADARHWIEALAQGRAVSVRDLARQSNRDVSEVSRTLTLAFVAPSIVCAVLGGSHSPILTPYRLKRATLPRAWPDQLRLLGISD